MKIFGIWILLTFGIYYFVAFLTDSEHPIGCLILAAILSTGITLASIL